MSKVGQKKSSAAKRGSSAPRAPQMNRGGGGRSGASAAKSQAPKLVLIGVGTAIALTVMVRSCNDSDADGAVDVERVQYDSLAACLADWNQPSDCGYVCDAPGTKDPSDNGAVAAVAGSASVDSGTALPQLHECTTVASTQNGASSVSSSGGSGGGGHSFFAYTGHWYGPYYTRSGTVYHANGTHTEDAPRGPLHGSVSSLMMRESSLSSGGSVFRRSPSSVSVSEGRAISRGGFTSSRSGGGSRGFGGGHGSSGG
ncbi:hypothetical protein [Burkholderia sp. Ax-1719]|uniref:hypothetical protein n=1 Tax=Burkholderia sp. Ax-1719 TaxID=2608334 RepID=UPI00141DE8FE|nr:hypothetical protein [Burkholderia sp. Ax-1719]NIE63329.1 hypothetical protein [Burkholderia sp. Ax-1719]